MAQRQTVAFRRQDWPGVCQSEKVSVDPVVVIAFAVDHWQAKAGERELLFLPAPRKNVLRGPLVDAVKPALILRIISRRRRHNGSRIILFFIGSRKTDPDQVDLSGAEKYIMAHVPAEEFNNGFRSEEHTLNSSHIPL